MCLADFVSWATGTQHIPEDIGMLVCGKAMSFKKEPQEKQYVNVHRPLLEGRESRRERDRLSYAKRVAKDPLYATRKRLRARGYPADVVAKMTDAEVYAIGAERRKESYRKRSGTRMNRKQKVER